MVLGLKYIVPAEKSAPTNGQAEAASLFQVKFAATLGLFPVEGIGNVNTVLPLLTIVTVCGLSVLVCPDVVAAKCRVGASE
jgi:hypothetical protein